MSHLERMDSDAVPKRPPPTSLIGDFRGDWRRWTATERTVGATLGLLVLIGPLMRLLTDLALH
jgi:hypothetical protein